MQRKCIDCGKINYAVKGLSGKRCKKCAKKHRNNNRVLVSDPNPTRYYQAGTRIDKPENLVTKPLCLFRTWCLPNDNRAYLHCGGCPKYEREDLEMTVYNRREYDPFEYAEVMEI
jgi:hypothetical protein